MIWLASFWLSVLFGIFSVWVCDNAPSKDANGTPPWWAIAMLLIAILAFLGVCVWGLVELAIAIINAEPEYTLE